MVSILKNTKIFNIKLLAVICESEGQKDRQKKGVPLTAHQCTTFKRQTFPPNNAVF